MEHLPVLVDETSISPVARARIKHFLQFGYPPSQIARKLSKGNPRKYKMWRARLRYLVVTDEEIATSMALQAKGELILSLPEVAFALTRRAKTGRMDASRLVFEASGFHNPRVQHDHSGEIQITLKGLPRPPHTEDVVDADVVEE